MRTNGQKTGMPLAHLCFVEGCSDITSLEPLLTSNLLVFSKENVPTDEAPAGGAEEGQDQAAEEESKTMTLDEYKAQLEKERFKADVQVRKAGEN